VSNEHVQDTILCSWPISMMTWVTLKFSCFYVVGVMAGTQRVLLWQLDHFKIPHFHHISIYLGHSKRHKLFELFPISTQAIFK